MGWAFRFVSGCLDIVMDLRGRGRLFRRVDRGRVMNMLPTDLVVSYSSEMLYLRVTRMRDVR